MGGGVRTSHGGAPKACVAACRHERRAIRGEGRCRRENGFAAGTRVAEPAHVR